MRRSQSARRPPRRLDDAAPGGGGAAAATAVAQRIMRGTGAHSAASLGASPYSAGNYLPPPQMYAKQRPPTAGPSSANLRADALQLEVRLAEGLQALKELEHARPYGADAAPGGGAARLEELSQRKLALFRSLFDAVIEREPAMGGLLRRIKAEYEAALAGRRSAGGGSPPREARRVAALRRERDEWKRRRRRSPRRMRSCAASSATSRRATPSRRGRCVVVGRPPFASRDPPTHRAFLTPTIPATHSQLEAFARLLDREEDERLAEAERRALDEAEAEAERRAAAEAELAREMPPSARRADITPTLGSGRLGVVGAPPPKPGASRRSIWWRSPPRARRRRRRPPRRPPPRPPPPSTTSNASGEGGPRRRGRRRRATTTTTDEDDGGGGWSRPPAVPSLVPKLGAAPKASYQEEFEAHEAAAAAAARAPEAFDTSAIDAMLYAKDPSRR